MTVTLSIKNTPEDTVRRLRQRAERNHRSLQGELLAIVEEAARAEAPRSVHGVLTEIRRLGLQTPDEAASIVRADRDGG